VDTDKLAKMTALVNDSVVDQLEKITYPMAMDEHDQDNEGAAPDPAALVGSRIRAARLARGMTQQDLATLVGVTRSAVAQWETERAGQLRGHLARISAALGVPVQFLLDGSTPPLTEMPENNTEVALLRLYRTCTEEDRAFLLRTATRLSRTASRERDEPS
jgi:transcriptional regulator with XRE-family HTH domain